MENFKLGNYHGNASRKRKRMENNPTWHLRASLHDLPCRKDLLLPHNLDVMHTEKNKCESIIGTLLGLYGKNKYTVSVRIDLVHLKTRKKY